MLCIADCCTVFCFCYNEIQGSRGVSLPGLALRHRVIRDASRLRHHVKSRHKPLKPLPLEQAWCIWLLCMLQAGSMDMLSRPRAAMV